MKAMVLEEQGKPLKLQDIEKPSPGEHQILINVYACGICRTDLHILDGDLKHPELPLIMGHQIVGTVVETGKSVTKFSTGDRVGVPWLGKTCQECEFCTTRRENLCDQARFTGYHINGGFAEYTVADEQFCFALPEDHPDKQVAPLLCAGLIGYRSYRKMIPNSQNIGFYGFGSAAHILIQVATYNGKNVYAFTRPGDEKGQEFARDRGAVWAGPSDEKPPVELDSAIIFAPVGHLVLAALKALKKGGNVVCAGIHMSDIPSFPYSMLWEERSIQSVANLTRKDGEEFFAVVPNVPITTEVTTYPLEDVNRALEDLRQGNFNGSGVIMVDG